MYGSGDSFIQLDVIPEEIKSSLMKRLLDETKFEVVNHKGGPLPRLVSIQGIIRDNHLPIYRHPIDKEPPLVPMSPLVLQIKDYVEASISTIRGEASRTNFNHVLIQYYRNGDDNISEHADKTIDIEMNSDICNYSVGGPRTMRLRSKKVMHNVTTDGCTSTTGRDIQKIELVDNSVFVLGNDTNRLYLHSIPKDGTCNVQPRISFTFRAISTFRNINTNSLVGKGSLMTNETPEGLEELLIAFRNENKTTADPSTIYRLVG
jgi:hypothetical protein